MKTTGININKKVPTQGSEISGEIITPKEMGVGEEVTEAGRSLDFEKRRVPSRRLKQRLENGINFGELRKLIPDGRRRESEGVKRGRCSWKW